MKKSRLSIIANRIFIIICVVAALGPIFWMLSTSLKTETEIYSKIPTIIPQKITLDAYSYLLTQTNFLNGLKNSLIVASLVAVLSILIGYPAAYSLARIEFKGKKFFSKSILFTYLLPTSVLYIPLYIFVSRAGLTNQLGGLVLIYPTFTLPYVAWILIPHISSIPVDLEEAAKMDGCNRFQIMKNYLLCRMKFILRY